MCEYADFDEDLLLQMPALIHVRMSITLDQLDHLKIKVYWKSINY